MRKSFVSPVPSCFTHVALRTGLVSIYFNKGWGALWASPSVSEMAKNVGDLDKSKAIVNYSISHLNETEKISFEISTLKCAKIIL